MADQPSLILRAAFIAPVAAPLILDGFVEFAGGHILRVGSARELNAADAARALDLGDSIVTPGLVNPHTHLELTRYAGKIPPGPFWSWIMQLIVLRRQPGQVERESAAVRDGAWQSLRSGVTCVGDISRMNLHWRALKDIPIRKVCFVELLALADSPPRNMAELRAAFDEVREDELLTAGISPHAPYTVPRSAIREAIGFASGKRRPWCMHLAETREEIAFLAGDGSQLPDLLMSRAAQCGVTPSSGGPIELIEHVASGFESGALAHLNYVSDRELDRLAATRHVAVYCPRAHNFYGHPEHPFERFRRAGVPVAIGTDSLASNSSLSIFEELSFVANARPHVEPAELLRMATLEGALALGLEGDIGSLEPGKQADIAVFPLSAPDDPLATLLKKAPAPTQVWVAGQRVI